MRFTLLQNLYFKKLKRFAPPFGQSLFLDGAKRPWLFLVLLSDEIDSLEKTLIPLSEKNNPVLFDF